MFQTIGFAISFFWVIWSSFSWAQAKPVKDVVSLAQQEFQELAIDLPFEKVYYGWKERVRENYKQAGRNLTEALTHVERDNAKAAELIDAASSLFRQCGLLLPFFEVDKTKIDEVMSRYLAAEDSLILAVRQLQGTQPLPTQTQFWKAGNTTWIALTTPATYTEAVVRCSRLQYAKSIDWRLPTFREMASAFREMKAPSSNPVFGAAAASFAEVWTMDRHEPEDRFYYVHFQKEKSGTAAPSNRYQVVCIGSATNR